MKRIPILTFLALMLPGAYAITPLYIGPVTAGNNPVAMGNGAVADCIKLPSPMTFGLLFVNPNPNPFFPPSPARPYLGETGFATLDPANPANAPVIAQNGGNPTFTRTEVCTPTGLAEIACSDGYPGLGLPANYVGVLEYTSSDLGANIRCSDHAMAFSFSSGASVQPRAAFMHRKQPYASIRAGTPGPGINFNLNCAANTLSVTGIPASAAASIKRVWIEAAPPASTMLTVQNACPANMPCTTATVTIPSGTDIHMYAIDNANPQVFAVESARC